MSTATSETKPIPDRTSARAPFDGKTMHDVVFTTCDNVDFYVAKAILFYSSPFFADMFSLAQPADSGKDTGDLQRIPISEDSNVFEILMRYCYPVEDPVVVGLAFLEEALEAALKYQIVETVKTLRALFSEYISSSRPPLTILRVYAIACRLKCESEASRAADALKGTGCGTDTATNFAKTVAGSVYTSHTASLTAGSYHRLISYLRPSGTRPPSFLRPPAKIPPRSEKKDSSALPPSHRIAPDVILRSLDGVDINAHSSILRLAGAEKLLEGNEESGVGGVPVHSVDIFSAALSDLVHMCYPFGTQIAGLQFERLAPLVRAAQKYEIRDVIAAARKQLMSFIDRQPMKVWFIAEAHGWVEETDAAARHIASRCIADQYVTEMEDVPAHSYHRLLRFCHRYNQASMGLIRSQVPNTAADAWSPSGCIADTLSFVTPPAVQLALCAAGDLASSGGSRCFSCSRRVTSHSQDCAHRGQLWPTKDPIRAALACIPTWEKLLQEKLSEVSFGVHLSLFSTLTVT